MKNGEFTEEQIENEKKGIISNIETIPDEQDTQIMYYFGQELSGSNESIEDYKQNVKNVTKQQILNIAKKVKINTTYFLSSNNK